MHYELSTPSILFFTIGIAVFLSLLLEGVRYALALRPLLQDSQREGTIGIIELPSITYLGTPGFFANSYGFLVDWANRAQKNWFRFRVRKHTVVTVFGKEARMAILGNRKYSVFHGYALLNPSITSLHPDADTDDPASFNWFYRRSVLPETIPTFMFTVLMDVGDRLKELADEGVLDPFDNFRNMIATAALRIIVGSEIVSHPTKLEQTLKAFRCLDELSPPVTLLFPWFPTPFRIRRFFAGIKLYMLFTEAMRTRRQSGKSQPDILQELLDGDNRRTVDDKLAASLLISSVFNAGGSSSMVFPWMQTWLTEHPQWAKRVREEVDAFVTANSSGKFDSLTQNLEHVPLDIWESSLPIIDNCLRETIRLALNNIVPRRIMDSDLDIDGKVIRKGEFVLYLTADVHFDPELYPNPRLFDPDRKYPNNRDYTFLGWGSGPHVCVGQRLGKLLVKWASVLLLSQFELEPIKVGGGSMYPMSTPKPRLFGIGEPERPVLLKYRRRSTSGTFRSKFL